MTVIMLPFREQLTFVYDLFSPILIGGVYQTGSKGGLNRMSSGNLVANRLDQLD